METPLLENIDKQAAGSPTGLLFGLGKPITNTVRRSPWLKSFFRKHPKIWDEVSRTVGAPSRMSGINYKLASLSGINPLVKIAGLADIAYLGAPAAMAAYQRATDKPGWAPQTSALWGTGLGALLGAGIPLITGGKVGIGGVSRGAVLGLLGSLVGHAGSSVAKEQLAYKQQRDYERAQKLMQQT